MAEESYKEKFQRFFRSLTSTGEEDLRSVLRTLVGGEKKLNEQVRALGEMIPYGEELGEFSEKLAESGVDYALMPAVGVAKGLGMGELLVSGLKKRPSYAQMGKVIVEQNPEMAARADATYFRRLARLLRDVYYTKQKDLSRIKHVRVTPSETSRAWFTHGKVPWIGINPKSMGKAVKEGDWWHELGHGRTWYPDPSPGEFQEAGLLIKYRDALEAWFSGLGLSKQFFYDIYSPTENLARAVARDVLQLPPSMRGAGFEASFKERLPEILGKARWLHKKARADPKKVARTLRLQQREWSQK